jgi:hypothetical protein
MVAVSAFAATACACADGYDHSDAAADEIGCERRQSIILILRIHVLALDIAGFLQTLEGRKPDDL